MNPNLKPIPYKPAGTFPNSWRFDFLADALHSRIILFTCPNGHCSSLYICNRSNPDKNHRIERDGEVKPSVGCPAAGCGYHEFIYLEDWRPEWINQ